MLRALLLALCLLTPAAWATTLLRADVPTLTRHADAIVRGKVRARQSHWTGDRMRIVTDVQIEVQEVLKGTPGKVVTVRQPGGVVGDIGQKVSGIAAFQPGEEVVVFLRRHGPVHQVVGMAQGKYHLEKAADGKLQAVPAPLGDAELVDPRTRAPVPGARTPVPLKTLKARIAKALKAPSAR